MQTHLFQSIMAASLDAISCADEQGRIILWNRAAEAMFGYSEAEALGQPLTMLLREEDRKAHLAGMKHFLKTNKPHNLIGKVTETFGLRKDGTVFPKEMSLAAEKVDGQWLFTAIMRDISERKQEEEALSKANRYLSLLNRAQSLRINPDGLFNDLLNGLLEVTGSECGFIDEVFYEADGMRPYLKGLAITNIAWDKASRDFYRDKAPFEMEFRNLNTLFGAVITSGKPVIANDAANDPRSGGLPEGHPAVNTFLGLPYFRGDTLLGMIGLANRVDGYDESIIGNLKPALATCVSLTEAFQEYRQRKQAEERLRMFTKAGIGKTGADYFRELVRAAAKALQVKCAFIAELTGGATVEARSLAVWVDGNFTDNFSWSLAGTPCDKISAGKPVYFMEHVQQACPDDAWLRDVGAESYFAIPFKHPRGRVMGHIGVLDDKPMPDQESMESLLGVFAERAGAELDRVRADEVLQQRVAEAEDTRQATLYMLEDLNESSTNIERIKQEWVATFDAVTDPIFLHDAEGTIIRANKAYASKAAMHVEDVIGRAYWQVFPKTDKRMQSGEEAVRCGGEEELTTDAGEIFAAHTYVMAGAEQEMAACVHWLEDITERKKAVEMLRESEANLKLAMQRNVEGIVVLDAEGNILDLNPAAAELLGHGEKELPGLPFSLPVSNAEVGVDIPTRDRGVRQVDVRSASGRWHGGDARFVWLHDRTEQVKAAEDLAESHERLQQSLAGTIQTITSVVEARDPYTAGHQQRVAKLAYAIAAEMRLGAEQTEGIHWGAMIHDLGKIHLPAEILSKPSKLTDIEYTMIKEHPQVGYDILKDIEFPWPVADIAHQHHERLDGSGYPRGLKGDEICLEARIVAVADVIEAMASHRPYRPGLGIDKALAEIKRGRGKQYDPQATDACITLFKENKFSFD